MKKTTIFYWIFTGLICAFILMGAIQNILVTKEWVDIMNHLHYPLYLIPFLGVVKLLAVIVLVIPGVPRLKEWAYAGLFFDIIGATYSSISVGDPAMGPAGGWILMLPILLVLALSYIFYHKKIKSAS